MLVHQRELSQLALLDEFKKFSIIKYMKGETMEEFQEPEPKNLRGFALEGEDQPIKEGE